MIEVGQHQLAALPYPYSALEPFLRTQLVEWHHDRIQAGYVAARNGIERALQELRRRGRWDDPRLAELKERESFYASSLILHEIYWDNVRPRGQSRPSGPLLRRIERDFGSYERWLEEFMAMAAMPENGWALLVHDPSDHRLRHVVVEGDGDGVIWGSLVLIACDLWEHAYYPQYGPHREDYVRAFVDLLSWEHIARRLADSPYAGVEAGEVTGGNRPLPPLPYGYDSLRGISGQVVRWHRERHHGEHLRARNRIERRLQALRSGQPEHDRYEFFLLKQDEGLHIAGQRLHELYWQVLGGSGGKPGGELLAAMEIAFGSLEGWRDDFLATARLPGMGWAVLAWDPSSLRLINLAIRGHQQGALWQATPLLPIDLWEHAYYYDRGPDLDAYLEACLANVNWPVVEALFRERL